MNSAVDRRWNIVKFPMSKLNSFPHKTCPSSYLSHLHSSTAQRPNFAAILDPLSYSVAALSASPVSFIVHDDHPSSTPPGVSRSLIPDFYPWAARRKLWKCKLDDSAVLLKFFRSSHLIQSIICKCVWWPTRPGMHSVSPIRCAPAPAFISSYMWSTHPTSGPLHLLFSQLENSLLPPLIHTYPHGFLCLYWNINLLWRLLTNLSTPSQCLHHPTWALSFFFFL